MKRSYSLGFVLASLSTVTTAGCGSVVSYVAQPAKVADSSKELEEVTQSLDPAPVAVEVTDVYLKVIYNRTTEVVRFSSIASTTLEKGATFGLHGPGHIVIVRDKSGTETLFRYNDQALAMHFVDALAAATVRAAKKP
jgi:hypothetical protein